MMDDKRSIKISADSIDILKEALETVPGWQVGEGSTDYYLIGLWRDQDFINFRVEETPQGVEAYSVNIVPQDHAQAPSLVDDEIFKVYQAIKSLPEDSTIGIHLNVSEQDIQKLSES
ncbi:hypothetical protein [Pectobacterium sp. 21LCBS03]|uniref:hypothetical protein n=1 Tax=unclassified Pectobacterium TaxID=2627739 RepID=UPI00200F98B9|nr:hypothetical protein [Pectobacterium sp. 21LCBS03]UPY93895.1 hypothetical protein MYB54_14980 [Pectobacterium sp. 21LCBS03]